MVSECKTNGNEKGMKCEICKNQPEIKLKVNRIEENAMNRRLTFEASNRQTSCGQKNRKLFQFFQ
jgi:hypothetical protein